jgi:hypothetical protein
MSLRLCLAALATTTVLAARPAAAEPSPLDGPPLRARHLLQVSFHGGGAWLGGDMDRRNPKGGGYGGLGLGYGLATRGVDLGASFDYLMVPDEQHPRRAYIPALSLRLHLPITESTEFGLGLRGGWSWLTMASVREDSGAVRDHTFSGLHLGLMPHLRFWLSRRLALDTGLELLVAGGGDSMAPEVRATYLERSARVSAFGGFARFSFGL